jgi:hypothetical protein
MRDRRWVAEHRGGNLTKEQHRKLMRWAITCAEHVLPFLGEGIDKRLLKALEIAKDWAAGKTTVGAAMQASVEAHAAARKYTDPVAIAVARAVGQAVATAHMADHSLGPALYGLKSVKLAGGSIDTERKWQNEQLPANLPPELKDLVLKTRAEKEKHFTGLNKPPK